MVHHSLTKDSQTVSWGAIRKYHIETQHWQDIGYHAGIEFINFYYEVLIGRRWNLAGAHCKEGNANERFLGFCFVGNFDIEAPSEQILRIAAERFFKPMFALKVASPKIVTHNQFAPYKSCPGLMFNLQALKTFCSI